MSVGILHWPVFGTDVPRVVKDGAVFGKRANVGRELAFEVVDHLLGIGVSLIGLGWICGLGWRKRAVLLRQ